MLLCHAVHVGPHGALNFVQQVNLAQAMPLAWLHVPKCGSTFVNVFVRAPGVCVEGISDRIVISQSTESSFDDATKDENKDSSNKLAASLCQGLYSPFRGHAGIAAEYDDHFKGHGIIMLRQPEQRLISGYNHGQHSWPYEKPASSLREYAETVAGCVVRMLTRGDQLSKPCGGPGPATDDEATLAAQRLRQGFVFVGLTDQWDLSVCLFHKLFGGDCASVEFLNSRPGELHTEAGDYNTSALDGFIDVHDRAVYDEAKEIFQAKLALYDVNSASCERCFSQART